MPDSGAARAWAVGLAAARFRRIRGGPTDDARPPPAPETGSVARAAFAIVLAIALLGCGAGVPWEPRLASGNCSTDSLVDTRLLVVAITAFAAAAFKVRQLIAVFQRKLEEHASSSRHDLAEAHARLHHITIHDLLNGLRNRNLLKERLARSLIERHHPGRKIAVAAIDLDRFSSINHSLGYAVGDSVLIEIAHRLEAVPVRHTIAGMGGDS